ncbi:energy transducer TonB [Flavobacteriaceae bacterium S0825]|uniref:energy transducer TonB n=1 Tax=Gaetbulibacter sp. S0825 TaxID=2720084 RepID=UPI00142FB2DC|nr:energy transducer TonB [Gaetbulibacter sp. S0825]MCK0109249.1 energy transducer TonB [Flavobacteriaceae bacterium S0825]NIX64884.1 energy transducer TonB [Gaetbulibacter sp. S0825]
MQVKKNPDVDVNRNSGLYFAIGLCLMLLTTNGLLNYKTYDKQDIALDILQMGELEVEDDIPIVDVNIPPPPPPPQAAPEVITIVEDVEEVEETVIESTETSMEEAIEERVEVSDVDVEEVEEDISVPFTVVEKVPIWPGCTGNNNDELKKCFQDQMVKHVNKNFEYPQQALELQIRGKVFVMFVIDSKGYVANVQVRGPDKILEKEASRIIALIPKMEPGKQRGKPVTIPYSLPINFVLAD